jgi:hypothetical protein
MSFSDTNEESAASNLLVQEQDRVFGLVQKHLRPYQDEHAGQGLRFPSVHLYLLNACLNRLGMQTKLTGRLLITEDQEGHGQCGGLRTDGFVLGVEFPGGHVINHRDQRGWDLPQEEHYRKHPNLVLEPHSYWHPVEEATATNAILKEVSIVDPARLTHIIGVVVSDIQHNALIQRSQPTSGSSTAPTKRL